MQWWVSRKKVGEPQQQHQLRRDWERRQQAWQVVQDDTPGPAEVPGLQATQVGDPGPAAVPAGQVLQMALTSFDEDPPGHG